MINNVVMVGRLTQDPELKEIRPGLLLGTINIAVNFGPKTKEEVCFIECKVWNKDAEALKERKKGEQVSVVGRLKSESWDDKESGKKRWKHVIMASIIEFEVELENVEDVF